jgi:hypothetical protein
MAKETSTKGTSTTPSNTLAATMRLPPERPVPSLVWWKFPMALSGNFHRSLSGGEVKRLSELSTEGAPAVNLP